MRIALAFFGLPRCSAIAFPSIAQNLLAPLAAAGELRVFCHLHRQAWIFNPRSRENHPQPEENYAPFLDFDTVIEPRPERPSPLFQRLRAFGDAWQDGFHSLANLVLQLQSLADVTRRLAAAAPDVVVFARPDLLYHEPVQPRDLLRALQRPDEIALPAWESWGGYNDRFAITGPRLARVYGERLAGALSYCEATGQPLHSETFLRATLHAAGAGVRPIGLRASRVRVDGRLEAEDFEGRRTPLAGFRPAGTGPRDP